MREYGDARDEPPATNRGDNIPREIRQSAGAEVVMTSVHELRICDRFSSDSTLYLVEGAAMKTLLQNPEQRIVSDVGGPTIEWLTSPEEEAYCIMRGTLPAGISVPLHSHVDAESFYVLSGEAQVLAQTEAGLEWKILRPGDFAHIPGGAKHAWCNLSEDPAEVLCVTTPRLGRFLREMGDFVSVCSGDGILEALQCLSHCYGYWLGSREENAEVGISLE